MIKMNVGDLVQVKPPEVEGETYIKGIGYVKHKTRATGKYSTWIIIQWMDDPQEQLEYSKSEVEFLLTSWDHYPIIKKNSSVRGESSGSQG